MIDVKSKNIMFIVIIFLVH